MGLFSPTPGLRSDRGHARRGRHGRCSLRCRPAAAGHRGQGRCGRDTQQPLSRSEASARQTPLRPAPPDRVLLQQTQAIPPRRHALRKDGKELPRRHHARRNHPMATASVHTTWRCGIAAISARVQDVVSLQQETSNSGDPGAQAGSDAASRPWHARHHRRAQQHDDRVPVPAAVRVDLHDTPAGRAERPEDIRPDGIA